MSVRTEADRKIEEAKDSLKNAHSCIMEVLSGGLWGADEYKTDFIDELYEMAHDLEQMKRKL